MNLPYDLHVLFNSLTMSLHASAGQHIRLKQGAPWSRSLHTIDQSLTANELKTCIQTIKTSIDQSSENDSHVAFIEIERAHSLVIQYGPFRIVYTEPPVSYLHELTIVKQITRLSLEDYHIDKDILNEITNHHHGILIAWSPGEGKSTFAQALTDYLLTKQLIIKTIEAPRDLQVDPQISQLSFSHASHTEIKDILLLSRPDITIFDEVRNHDDFHLYQDLRLAGIGMIGVMHATEAIDALQRFLHAVDLWSVAHVISYIVFIRSWSIHQVFHLQQTVKVPQGMHADDLARPVIEVYDLQTKSVTHEIYSFGEQVVVMPLQDLGDQTNWNTLIRFATEGIETLLTHAWHMPVDVVVHSPRSITVTIPKHAKGEIIWRNGSTIKHREEKLWCSIHIETHDREEDVSRFGWKSRPTRKKSRRK